jgi:hypothetical protein
MRYFDVGTDDVRFANRWFLDEPLTKTGAAIDAREFIHGRPYLGPVPVNVPIQQDGRWLTRKRKARPCVCSPNVSPATLANR